MIMRCHLYLPTQLFFMPVFCYTHVHLSSSCLLTLLVYILMVVGLASLFDWPVLFRFFSSVPPPPRFSGRDYRSLAWIADLLAFVDLGSCTVWHEARYGFHFLGMVLMYFCFSDDDVLSRLVMFWKLTFWCIRLVFWSSYKFPLWFYLSCLLCLLIYLCYVLPWYIIMHVYLWTNAPPKSECLREPPWRRWGVTFGIRAYGFREWTKRFLKLLKNYFQNQV